jgi:hypothetical protein
MEQCQLPGNLYKCPAAALCERRNSLKLQSFGGHRPPLQHNHQIFAEISFGVSRKLNGFQPANAGAHPLNFLFLTCFGGMLLRSGMRLLA